MLESAGWLLRVWRLGKGWTQAEVAAAVGVGTAATVSAWETDTNRIPLDALERLDEAFGAKGCLLDLVRALRTPEGFSVRDENGNERTQPRLRWGHIFLEGGPGWVWLRPARGRRVNGSAYAGAVGITISEDVDPGGVFIANKFMDPQWPAFVVLAEPGWVDFGRGVLPAWLDQPLKYQDDLRSYRFVRPRDRSVSFYIGQLRQRDRGDPTTLRDRLRSLVDPEGWDSMEASYRCPTECSVPPHGAAWATGPHPPATADQRRVMHRRLREARGLSQAEAATKVTHLLEGRADEKPVRLHQVHNYESGRASRVPHLPALLDRVYGGFGWTCYEPVTAMRVGPGHFTVRFPQFWLGPVCVTAVPLAVDPSGGQITFAWTKWQLVRDLPATATSFTFCCVPDAWTLDVRVPPDWEIEAHMGQNPDALDANSDWVPVDEAAGNEIFEHYVTGWLRILGKTTEDLARALDS